METKTKFRENCSICDKFIDFRRDVEGKGWQQNEDGEFEHLKCLKSQLDYQCEDCHSYWGGGQDEEDSDGNIYLVCQECHGTLVDVKPKLKDLRFEPRYCICGHSEGVHSHWREESFATSAQSYDCYLCGDFWKLKETPPIPSTSLKSEVSLGAD